MKDGLARSRELSTLPQDSASGTDRGPLAPLATALAARGLTLSVIGPDAALADPAFRRAVLALGLAGADLASPGATVQIVLDDMPAGRRVTLAAPAGLQAFCADGFGMTLARRVVESAGGKLRVEPSVDRVTLVAELPLMAVVASPSSRIALGA
jgi:hypothetical protein